MQSPADSDWFPRSGTVRARGDRTADRDVWQRREVRQREAVAFQRAAQVAVADPGFDRDRLVPDLDDAVEVLRREERARSVPDEAEGMARAERPDRLGTGDQLLRLGHRRGRRTRSSNR